MPPEITERWVPVNRPGEASSSRGNSGGGTGGGGDGGGGGGRGGGAGGRGRGGGVGLAADRLSALPDALLHHVMSFMKAWDVVRTCVLSRRWRSLWASAPCVDIRVGSYSDAPEDFAKFVYRLLLAREDLAPVETLRLRTPGEEDYNFNFDDVRMWIRHAIRRNVRVIQLNGHAHQNVELDGADFVSCNLRVLKLSYAEIEDKDLKLICSRCTSLEELELKHCEVRGREFVSASLKHLTMVKCKFTMNLSVNAPKLVSLQCILPENWVPLFKNFGALVAGSGMLDDSLLSREFEKYKEEDEFPQTSDEDDENNSTHARRTGRHAAASDDSDEYTSDDWDDFYDDYSGAIKDDYDYGSDINSDTDTYEYGEIVKRIEVSQYENLGGGSYCSKASKNLGSSTKYIINDYKKLGGQNVIQSLSIAQTLQLLGHSGEVVLRRESMSCPVFSNLKTLALGEWCISTGADFDILILLLQHSPKLEKLFLQLEMSHNIGEPVNPKGGSFACKHLSMVKIRCTKDDPRLHVLAQLFRSNGVPFEKIYVRRSGSFYLRNLKLQREITLNCVYAEGENVWTRVHVRDRQESMALVRKAVVDLYQAVCQSVTQYHVMNTT